MKPKVTKVVFSPGGSVKGISDLFCTLAGWEGAEELDLLRRRDFRGKTFQRDEIAVVAAPVFFGRIPEIVARKLRDVKGDSTPAIAMVVYGNRDYEDALIELADLLTANGFVIYGAGAFVGRHSIYPGIAKERPDEEDEKILRAFALHCAENIKKGGPLAASIKGNRPYRPYGRIPFYPKGDSRCTACGTCVETCPVRAIPKDAPRRTDKALCINCTACIHVCPVGARSYGGLLYHLGGMKIKKACSGYRTPEFFV